MKRIVIADDLTGANNVGVLLTKQGLSTVVVTYRAPAFPGACDVLCVDTDSRYVTPEEAARRVHDMVARGLSQGTRLFCNRIDNLLRGNIGAETGGMLNALGADALAVVAPAFPVLKRHVVDGHLLVDGTPVHEHPIAANDPIAPVRHSFIADILGQQLELPVSTIPLADVEAGAEALAARLEREAASGIRAVVVDAISDTHLGIIAQAMAALQRPCVPVDPGPLSALYLRACREAARPARAHRVLATVGSVTPLSQQQLRLLLAQSDVTVVRVDAQALIASQQARQEAVRTAVAECLAQLDKAAPVVALTTHQVEHHSLNLEQLAKQRGVTAHQLAKQISDGLAQAAFETLAQSKGQLGGCFSSGGDVTASLFQISRAEAIKILGDVVPLTAYVELIGGRLHGLRMVTKGGSIGDETTLVECVQFLRRALEDE